MNVIGPEFGLALFWWIATPIALFTVLSIVVALVLDDENWGVAFVLGAILTATALLFGVGLHFPYNAKYWSLYEATGTVMNVTNSFEDGGEYTARSWVVELEGQSTVYVLDDPRAATLDLGDKVDLTCSIQWVYQSQDRINCAIDGIERGVATDTVEVIP